jgi:hypothetical protein
MINNKPDGFSSNPFFGVRFYVVTIERRQAFRTVPGLSVGRLRHRIYYAEPVETVIIAPEICSD